MDAIARDLGKKFRILLIDDDKDFGSLFISYANDYGIDADYFDSLSSTGSVGSLRNYDAIVLDVNLNQMTGYEIAEYVQAFFGNKPVILTSSESLDLGATLPHCIKSFVPKQEGMESLIREIGYFGFGSKSPFWEVHGWEL
jgi:CheY-like chemotaxis protein